jgi:hypothetical protein
MRLNPSANSEVVIAPVREASATPLQFALRLAALVLLLSAGAVYESSHLSSLNTPEVWVHLRTGTWMLDHHAIPRTGLFSQYSSLRWGDSTWGFDLLVGFAYRILGMRAIPILLMTLKVAVALATFLLARSGSAGFWQSAALSAVAQYVITGLHPLPYVLSILFLAAELGLLLNSRISGSIQRLYWLPPLFVIWANLHVQFVVGLILLAVFVTALLVEHWLRTMGVAWLSARVSPLHLRQVSVIATLSLLATFITPYGYRLFGAFLRTSYSDVGFEHFSEMSAIGFRRPQDYVLMLLVMMAFLALGQRRSLELFELLILLGGTGVAFRIQRDGWIVVLAAVAVLAGSSFLELDEPRLTGRSFWEWRAVAATTAIILAIAAVHLPDRFTLINRARENLPAKACDYIAANKLPGPLFNEYLFGSFLTWYLPTYPVVVDSRVELYGNTILAEYFDVIGGKERLDSHPMIADAGTLLLERNSAMAKALKNLPALRAQYRLAYSDNLADVFIPQGKNENR